MNRKHAMNVIQFVRAGELDICSCIGLAKLTTDDLNL